MKTVQLLSTAAIGAAMLALAAPASASIVSADFNANFDLPDSNRSTGPRVFENLAAPLAAGNELDDTHETQNPSGWGGSAFVDLSETGLLTITGSQPNGFADYDFASFTISNIMFDTLSEITGVATISEALLDPGFGLGAFSPVITFAADSVSFVFDTSGSGANADFEFLDGGTSTYQLRLGEVAAEVPLPAGMPLLLLGLGAMGVVRSRRARKA